MYGLAKCNSHDFQNAINQLIHSQAEERRLNIALTAANVSFKNDVVKDT